MITIRKLDGWVTGTPKPQEQLYVILNPDGECVLADTAYLEKWIEKRTTDKVAANHLAGLVEIGCTIRYDDRAEVWNVRTPQSE